jgi:hypothetical protein
MSTRSYINFDLILSDVKLEAGRVSKFSARVFDSPAGAAPEPDVVTVPTDLETLINRLRNRDLDADRPERARLGLALANLLLPDTPGQTSTRDLFQESWAWLREDEGLRLRVRAPAELAGFPWEFASFPRQAPGTHEPLLVDRRISLVRYEALAVPLGRANDHKGTARYRVVYATASPEPFNLYPPLPALTQERGAVRVALSQPGIDLVTLPNSDDLAEGVTPEQLSTALGEATHVLHFSGHGEFAGKGGGSIVLANKANSAVCLPAEKLGEMLRGLGVRLVVLGACHTADRDARNPWGSVAGALLRAGVPAVVAMQDSVQDKLTAAFCAAFYKAVVAGRLVDEAVSNARIAMRRAALGSGSPDVRDWASPVLYLRSTGAVFRTVGDPTLSNRVPPKNGWWMVLVGLGVLMVIAAIFIMHQPQVQPDTDRKAEAEVKKEVPKEVVKEVLFTLPRPQVYEIGPGLVDINGVPLPYDRVLQAIIDSALLDNNRFALRVVVGPFKKFVGKCKVEIWGTIRLPLSGKAFNRKKPHKEVPVSHVKTGLLVTEFVFEKDDVLDIFVGIPMMKHKLADQLMSDSAQNKNFLHAWVTTQ